MKNIIKYIWMLAAVILFAACSDDNNTESETAPLSTEIFATADGHASTRTQIGEIAGDGNLKMQWLAKENIGVVSSNNEYVKFTSHNATPQDWASFKGEMKGEPKYAFYPYDATVTGNFVTINIPTNQEYKDYASIAPYDYKASTSIEKRTLGYYRMNFRQMTSLICLDIDLSTLSSIDAGERISKVEISGELNLAGTYSYNLTNLDEGLTADQPSTSVAVSLINTPLVSEKTKAYMIVAPGSMAGKTCTFKITTDKHILTFSTSLLLNMEAGKFYDLPLTTEVLTNNNVTVSNLNIG